MNILLNIHKSKSTIYIYIYIGYTINLRGIYTKHISPSSGSGGEMDGTLVAVWPWLGRTSVGKLVKNWVMRYGIVKIYLQVLGYEEFAT